MLVQPSTFPGSYERHFLRKADNPLFTPVLAYDDAGLLIAQQQDHEILQSFTAEFKALLQTLDGFAGSADDEEMFRLKERLDSAYETASRVADDQTETKDALLRLIDAVMKAIRQGMRDDQTLLQQLEEEEAAREAHFKLMASPLAADLLHEASVVAMEELMATLLSTHKEELAIALQLFDAEQLHIIIRQSSALLAQTQADATQTQAWEERLAFMEQTLNGLRQPLSPSV